MMKKLSVLLLPPVLLAASLQTASALEPNPFGPKPKISISAHSNAVYEGRDIKINFTIQTDRPSNSAAWRTCYNYRTEGGSAAQDGYFRDYTAKSGKVCWNRYASRSDTLAIETLEDQRCEHDETFRIVLSQPVW